MENIRFYLPFLELIVFLSLGSGTKAHAAPSDHPTIAVEVEEDLGTSIDSHTKVPHSSLKDLPWKKKLQDFAQTLPTRCRHKDPSFEDLKYCAQKHFVIRGNPINHRLIEAFIPGVSEHGDHLISLNLLEVHQSPRYSFSTENTHIIKKSSFHEVVEEGREELKQGFFKYSVEGITENGIYVLMTSMKGDGSGVYRDALFARLVEKEYIREGSSDTLLSYASPSKEKTLALESLGRVTLGDRVEAKISIKGNKVDIQVEALGPVKEGESSRHIVVDLNDM